MKAIGSILLAAVITTIVMTAACDIFLLFKTDLFPTTKLVFAMSLIFSVCKIFDHLVSKFLLSK